MTGQGQYLTAARQTKTTRATKANPYISDIYKEKDLLTASNAYHRLDRSQNFMVNKAFAHTIINDLKQK